MIKKTRTSLTRGHRSTYFAVGWLVSWLVIEFTYVAYSQKRRQRVCERHFSAVSFFRQPTYDCANSSIVSDFLNSASDAEEKTASGKRLQR